jgi:hypothetical protein
MIGMTAGNVASTADESVSVVTLERRPESIVMWMASDVSTQLQSFQDEGIPGAEVTANRNGPRMWTVTAMCNNFCCQSNAQKSLEMKILRVANH